MIYRVIRLTEVDEGDVKVLTVSLRLLDQRGQDEYCVCPLPAFDEPEL